MISRSEIESVIRKLPANKIPGTDGFTGESYKKIQRAYIEPSKHFQKIEEEGTLPKSF